MQNYDRLSILVSLVLLGLALTLVVQLPVHVIEAELLGTPIAVTLSTRLIMAALLSALTATGVEYIMQAHPSFAPGRGNAVGYSFLFWILPTLVTLAGAWFTPQLIVGGNLGLWAAGMAVTALLLATVIMAEYRTVTPSDSLYTPARLFLNLVTYGGALLLFSSIYGAKLRSALSASMVTFFAILLALTLLRGERTATARTWVYAGICGLILGEATWALNYWGVGGLAGGAVLVLLFYFFTGVSQQRLLGRFSRSIFVEYGVVGLVALFILGAQGALTW